MFNPCKSCGQVHLLDEEGLCTTCYIKQQQIRVNKALARIHAAKEKDDAQK